MTEERKYQKVRLCQNVTTVERSLNPKVVWECIYVRTKLETVEYFAKNTLLEKCS